MFRISDGIGHRLALDNNSFFSILGPTPLSLILVFNSRSPAKLYKFLIIRIYYLQIYKEIKQKKSQQYFINL